MSEPKDPLYAMRHSLAHIMASAVSQIWPEAKFGVGPVTQDGFYYDIDLSDKTISEEDFAEIEKRMRKLIEDDDAFEQYDLSIEDAIKWAKDRGQPYKLELLNDLKREGTTSAKDLDAAQLGVASDGSKVEKVSFYKNGGFNDLCRGPHVASTGQVGAFKLTRVAGAFWRGDDSKPQMQRLYGVAFPTQKELDAYLEQLEEAKKRDHRVLGRQLDLFVISDLIGSGLPMFTPRGTVLRELLGRYSQELRAQRGFERVWTPHITKIEAYKTSGHWDKFGDELFLVKSQESSDEFALKPMNCPHHIQIYASQQRSYRDLPVKYMENTTDYRDEKSGELHGLSRVRSLTQDDSHAFVREDQIEETVTELVQAAQAMYKELDLELKFNLSFRDDGKGYLGDAKVWETAQASLERLAKQNKLDYTVAPGDAAFYGPKIDFIATDGLGREWQLATVQLDFVQPSRFKLEYTAEDGSMKTPVMVHCALMGAIERFLSIYIEHTAGVFPFWLAPEQVRVLAINDEVADYVSEVANVLDGVLLMEPLKYNELRYHVDARNESLGRKIRDAVEAKVPVSLIVGPKDRDAQAVSVRLLDGEEHKVPLAELADFLLAKL